MTRYPVANPWLTRPSRNGESGRAMRSLVFSYNGGSGPKTADSVTVTATAGSEDDPLHRVGRT